MGKELELIGLKFNFLTVVKKMGETKQGISLWECLCDCGNTSTVIESNIKNGHTKSCGCYKTKVVSEVNLTHGHTAKGKNSPTYNSWAHMKRRCLDANNPGYKNYGGRGIKVCKRWMKFENFLVDMGECIKGHSIERMDVNGNYEPENCKWIPKNQQKKNTTKSLRYTINKETKCLKDWATHFGISYYMLWYRIKKGLDFNDIVKELRGDI